jgi:nucleotide-binding universal stress UspA family protein
MLEIKKILIPVDFSETGSKVIEQAIVLAKKTNAEILLITVLEGLFANAEPNYFRTTIYENEKYEGLIIESADKRLKELKEKLLKEGVGEVNYLIKKGTPYTEILSASKETNADIIVMGTHGISGFREFVLGSNSFKVISEAKCPVLSIQLDTKNADFKNILLPFRDNRHSREDVDYGIKFASMYGAILHILGISYDPASPGVNKIAREADQIKFIAEKEGVTCKAETVQGNYVTKLIFDNAERLNADLIVVMSDLDKMSISEYITGPVIQQIVNHSKIPVLSIRPIINPEMFSNSDVDWAF